ncbi:hypothetical protein HBI24_250750 [Parastagonospora nodorum]|nr:hypothetical protein HBI00_046430 [Parastagonospora nodorum]KAH4451050.1 hypothetical protein HBH90_190260 [Parastagonospora nodorum]KAH4496840.1 hypothetical protein HBH88_093350 [Parastagonospora nodorum]KAH5562803.1 hypothetical protein HBI24_250750 [Parastagonospora nodorum]
MLILILSKTAYIILLTKLAILNNTNITLNNNNLLSTINSYIKLRKLRVYKLLKLKYILLTSICNRLSLKRYKTKIVDSKYAKVSRRKTKKDKDLENSNTSSNILRLYRRDRVLKKTRDKEKLAKAKKEKEKKEA